MKKTGSENPISGQCAGDLVEERIGPRRGKDPDWQRRDQQRKYLRRTDNAEGRRQALQDQRIDIYPTGEE